VDTTISTVTDKTPQRKRKTVRISDLLINLFFLVFCTLMAIPIVLVISVSLSSNEDLLHYGYTLIPRDWSAAAYKYILQSPGAMLRAYGVTMTVTVVGTMLGLLLTAMIGYGISRSDYRYNRITTLYVFFTMLFSGGLVPFYILMTRYLHLKNSIWAMILPGLLSPFYVMIMRGFLVKIPMEIIDSAKMDGASEWRIFFRFILPLAKPPLATLGLFISFNYWNEWFNALLYIDNQKLVPLQLLLVRIMNTIDFLTSNLEVSTLQTVNLADFPNDSARMAIAVLTGGPMMLVFPFFQKYFVKGLTVGSLKG